MRRAWFLAIATVFVLGAGARAQQQVGMPQYVGIPSNLMNQHYTSQRSAQWCWAACIQMALSRYGITVPQEEIVRRTYGTDPQGRLPDMPASIQTITANLNNWGIDVAGKRYVVRAAVGYGPPPSHVLVSELAAGSPIILACNTGPIGHAIVCTGAGYVLVQSDPSGASQPVPWVQTMIVRDPWPRQAPAGSPDPAAQGRAECRADQLAPYVAWHWCIRAQVEGQPQSPLPPTGTGPQATVMQPSGRSEREPNDEKRLANLAHGLTISGSMASAADVDWFVLGGQEGTRATFTITHAPGNNFDFEVYSGDRLVGKAVGVQPGDTITCDVPGQCFIRVWSARGAGPYAIVIHPSGMSEREPNDEKRTADLVRGLTLSGGIAATNDVDWFVLGGQEGTRATFTIVHAPANDFDFEVYSDNQLVGRAVGVQSGDSITCDVPGQCSIRVWSAKGIGPYAIAIRPIAGGTPGASSEREPNNEPRLANPVTGLAITGAIETQKDVDWFVLAGQEGTTPTFTITHGPANDFDFEVYSDDHLAGRAIGIQSGDTLRCQVPGRCFIRVWSARGTGPYQIQIVP